VDHRPPPEDETTPAEAAGPLRGIRVLELAGIGPGPFAAMLLADLGAEVVRVERREPAGRLGDDPALDLLYRGRRSIALDLKHADGLEAALRLVERADALIEGYRPGVTERLGLGPTDCLARNPRLVYGRMTGWGQEGPLAATAGHDVAYIALAGALGHIGAEGAPPVPPINLLGDFGGGGAFLAFGIVAALLEAARSGVGQVVDAAIVDGVASMMTPFHGLAASGLLRPRGTNLLDGGAPFYDTYLCADGGYVALAALEPQFYAAFLDGVADTVDTSSWPDRNDPAGWRQLRACIAATFLQRTRDAWATRFDGTDACVAPVLSLDEAVAHPHLAHRDSHHDWAAGGRQPAGAPRFSRSAVLTADSADDDPRVVRAWGLDGRS
jgi:alpha-methylacyl-CoA racemase